MPTLQIDAPELTAYARLEPSLRLPDYQPTISAQVHDALWMLTQQWRMREFEGTDGGSLMKVKVETQSSRLNRYKAGEASAAEALDTNVPLEAKVEHLPMTLDLGMQLEIGLQWLKILQRRLPVYRAVIAEVYLLMFPLALPDDSPVELDERQLSNMAAIQIRTALAGRALDGGALITSIINQNTMVPLGVDPSHTTEIQAANMELLRWFTTSYYQPLAQNDAWSSRQLEYQFSLSVPEQNNVSAQQQVFVGNKYQSGTVDWYSVDLHPDGQAVLTEDPAHPVDDNVVDPVIVESYIPQPVTFKGMPVGRWWEFEDRNIDLAKMLTQKQDIAKLVVMEFGLIFGNDWFILPHKMKVGTTTKVNGMAVTDTFGIQYLIDRAGTGSNHWNRWAMYNISTKAEGALTTYKELLLMPKLVTRIEGRPVEEVQFLRDEMANMVWGVEDTVPDELGSGIKGKDAYRMLMDYLLQDYTLPLPGGGYEGNTAKLRYRLTTSVPENWIPFVPVNTGQNDREIALTRASIYRYLDGEPTGTVIRPRTALLSEGLPNSGYAINEEEVSKSGLTVSTSFQRTRWYDGSTFTWLGRKVVPGRGPANSGLKYDFLADKEDDS